jgi:ABC-2 type transport system ATP-binding protein
MTLAIETKLLTRFFSGFCAVDHVNLQVERGTFYGFLGRTAQANPPQSKC